MTGQEFIFKADSFKYGYNNVKKGGDTISFFIKEVVVSKIEDSSGTTFTMARYHSKDTINWIYVKNHFYEIEKFRLNHKENNIITTNLVFPVSNYYYWNGNELNNLATWEYSYSMVNADFTYGAKTYKNSVKVKMDSIVNYVNHDIVSEIYTKNIGLVYREDIHLTYRNNDSLDDNGIVVLQRPPVIDKGIVFKKGLIRNK